MAAPEPVYVVLTITGKVWSRRTETGYFGLLRDIYVEQSGAGGNWDAPSKLLVNGEMVITGKLWEIAYAYCKEEDEARWASQKKVAEKHTPDWLHALRNPEK